MLLPPGDCSLASVRSLGARPAHSRSSVRLPCARRDLGRQRPVAARAARGGDAPEVQQGPQRRPAASAAAAGASQRLGLRRPPHAARRFLQHLTGSAAPPRGARSAAAEEAGPRAVTVTGSLALRRFLRACVRPKRQVLRLNRLKAEKALLGELNSLGWVLAPVPWCGDGFTVEEVPFGAKKLGHGAAHLRGQLRVQEATSMLPVEALRAALAASTRKAPSEHPEQGPAVLDLCAAPGSKATQLASWLSEEGGVLIANEPPGPRWRELRKNLVQTGAANFCITRMDGRSLGALAPAAFDAVLADVPCSCEGCVRKDGSAWERWFTSCGEHLQNLLPLQRELLTSAWKALRPDGVLVYATCTLNRLENEMQCRWFREACSATPFAAAEMDVRRLLAMPDSPSDGPYLRILPHNLDTEGFFLACFRKVAKGSSIGGRGEEAAAAAAAAGRPQAGGERRRRRRRTSSTMPSSRADALRSELSEAYGVELSPAWSSGVLMESAVEGSKEVRLLPKLPPPLSGLGELAPEPGISVGTLREEATRLRLKLADEFLLWLGQDVPVGADLDLSAPPPGAGAGAGRRPRPGAGAAPDWNAVLARVSKSLPDWNARLDESAREGSFGGVEAVWSDLLRSNLKPDVISFSIRANACASSGDLQGALDILSSMRDSQLEPNVVSYSALMTSRAKAADMPGVELVLETMQAQAVAPNHFSFNSLIDAHARRGDAAGAEAWLSRMRQMGPRLRPNVVNYNTVLKAYARGRDFLSAGCFIDDMQLRRVSPDEVTFQILIRALSLAGDAEGARRAVAQMQSYGIAPNIKTLNLLPVAHNNVGQHELVRDGDEGCGRTS